MAGREADDLISAVTVEITGYLALNGSAGDTATGVWRWWLSATRNKVVQHVVEVALERLAANGAIGVRVLASGERYYFALDPQATEPGGGPGNARREDTSIKAGDD